MIKLIIIRIKFLLNFLLYFYFFFNHSNRKILEKENNNKKVSFFEKENFFFNHKKYKVHGSRKLNFLKIKKKIKLSKPFILYLKNATLIGKSSNPIVLDNKLNIILESINNHHRYLYYSESLFKIFSFKFFKKKKIDYLDLSVVNFIGTISDNKFHWLTEYLPRILYFYENKTIGSYHFLLSSHGYEFQRNLLNLFGVKDDKIIIWNKLTTRVREIIIPSLRFDYYKKYKIFSQKTLSSFKNIICKKYNSLPNTHCERIYIKRRNNKRPIANEDCLILQLKKHGFEIVILEDLTETKIVNYFRDAKIVIGMHGAGLTNIIFSQKIKIIEFLPDYINEEALLVFYQLSMIMGFEHHVLTFNSIDSSNKIHIDITKVLDMI